MSEKPFYIGTKQTPSDFEHRIGDVFNFKALVTTAADNILKSLFL